MAELVGFDSDDALNVGLAVREAMINAMVHGNFWNDDDGSRLRSAYFDEFAGVWHHGDWITFTLDGSCVISGRSDAALSPHALRSGASCGWSTCNSSKKLEPW